MALKICRLCLSTDISLQELNENLLDYFQDICDYTSGFSKHLCCSICKDALKKNLDFRNKCLESNKILQEWKRNKTRKKPSIDSLHKLLHDFIEDTKTKERNKLTKCKNTRKGSNKYCKNNDEITTDSVTDNVISYSGNSDEGITTNSFTHNVISYSENSDEEIKVEIKDEVKNDDTFEVINCGAEHDVNNSYEINNESVNDEIEIKNDENDILNDNTQPVVVNETVNDEKGMKNDKLNDTGLRIRIQLDADNKILIDCVDAKENKSKKVSKPETIEKGMKNYTFKDTNESDDDNMFLIDCVGETIDAKEKKLNKVSKTETVQKQEKRVYPRKGLSEYSQYEEVFEIQLFNTDEDARQELLQRRVSEPYVSAKYRCELCYTVYKCDKLLKFHMRWHDPSAEFACDICGMSFSARKAVQCHKAKCHRGRFACKVCPLITYYGSAMKAHFQKHQGKVFICHCDRVFKHISSYLTHKRTVHASTHVCVTCARTFVSEFGLLNHRARAHQSKSKVDSDGTTRCEPCGLTFANQQVYTVHVLNTDGHKDAAKDMIACPYCGLSFDDVAQLKLHKRHLHPKKKDTNDIFKCDLCGAEGKGRVWRWRHYGTEHPLVRYREEVSEAKIHMCDQCGKRFTNITIMKDHMNSHTGLKPYTCAHCPRTFSSAIARRRHVENHAPPSRTCGTCGARCLSASNLAVHMRMHIGIPRHKCDICSKAFLHGGTLREHVRGVHRHIKRVRAQPRDKACAD